MYRVNFGNCQVSGGFKLLKQAREYLALCDGYAYLERWDSGEYFPCDKMTGHFLDMTAKKNKDHPAYSGKKD